MKKRRIIVVCSIIGVLIVLVGVFAAMFNLQHINVEIVKNPDIVNSYGANICEDIVKSGDFAYGSNTLFSSYEESQKKIEKAYPFVKVEKMVRKFPDKMTIFVSGRKPEVIVEDPEALNTWYILDIDKKVLAVINNFSDLQNGMYKDLPVVKGSDIKNVESGDFLNTKSAEIIVDILDGIYGKDKTKSSVMSDITLDLEREKYTIILRDGDTTGAKIEINGVKEIKEKVFIAYSLYKLVENDSRFPDKQKMYFIVGKNFVYETNEKVIVKYDGEEVTW